MPKITINKDLCKGCGLCAEACPKRIIEPARNEINKKGHNPVRVTDEKACIGCAFCALMCPDCVIKVEK